MPAEERPKSLHRPCRICHWPAEPAAVIYPFLGGFSTSTTGHTMTSPNAKDICQQGVRRHAQGDFAAAIADFSEALRLDPGYAEAWNNRGVAHQAAGDLDPALADYEEALRLDPGYA